MISNNRSLVRSTSRKIQSHHTRRYSSGKVVPINPGVKKSEKITNNPISRQKNITLRPILRQPMKIEQKPRPQIQLKPRPPKDKLILIRDKNVFRNKLIDNSSFNQNIWNWITKNKEELMDTFWKDWLDYVERESKTDDLNKLFEEFIEDELYFNSWEDSWGGKDKVYIEFFGDFSDTMHEDPDMFSTVMNADVYGEFSYFMDPFNNVILENDENGFSNGTNPKHLEDIMELSAGDFEEYRKYGSLESKADTAVIKKLEEEKIPFVLTEDSYKAFISVPNQFADKAKVIIDGIKKHQKQ